MHARTAAAATPASRRGRSAGGPTRLAVIAIVAGAIVLGLIVEYIADSWIQPAYIPIADLGVGWVMIGCGLVAAAVRPSQPAGWRLVLAGFLWFLGTFMGGQDGTIERWFGFGLGGYHDLVLAWIALSFPDRWPVWGPSRVILAVAAGLYVAQTVARLVFFSPATFDVTVVDADTAMTIVLWLDVIRGAAMLVAGVVMLVRLGLAHGSERRMLAPVLLAGAASMVAAAYTAQYAATVLGFAPELDNETVVPIAWAFNVIRVVVPLTILYGVLQLRGARSAIAGAVADVGEAPTAGALQGALATALGDRELRILTWDPVDEAFVGTDGSVISDATLSGLAAEPGLGVVRVDAGADPLAVLVVARSIAESPALLDAGVSLTRLVVRNEQQAVRIQEQLAEVRASRARIVEAADVERRRIERDLHDGLQQRMVTLAMQLRAAEGTGSQDEALRRGSAEILAILEDVRELARGIHPAVLSEAGLAAAIRAAADRSIVPAELDLQLTGTESGAAQATAYFVVSEALANVAKHAPTSNAVWIHADDAGGLLRVVVEDDGPGGADAAGHGLAGLADRVAALDGTFAVESGTHGGTRIVAEVPIA